MVPYIIHHSIVSYSIPSYAEAAMIPEIVREARELGAFIACAPVSVLL